MREWLVQNGMDRRMLADVEFPTDKPPAHMAIDDRAVQFVGSFMEPDQIAAFRTWQQQAQSIASKGRADER